MTSNASPTGFVAATAGGAVASAPSAITANSRQTAADDAMFIPSLPPSADTLFLRIHGKTSAPPETGDIYFWQFRRRALFAECLL